MHAQSRCNAKPEPTALCSGDGRRMEERPGAGRRRLLRQGDGCRGRRHPHPHPHHLRPLTEAPPGGGRSLHALRRRLAGDSFPSGSLGTGAAAAAAAGSAAVARSPSGSGSGSSSQPGRSKSKSKISSTAAAGGEGGDAPLDSGRGVASVPRPPSHWLPRSGQAAAPATTPLSARFAAGCSSRLLSRRHRGRPGVGTGSQSEGQEGLGLGRGQHCSCCGSGGAEMKACSGRSVNFFAGL